MPIECRYDRERNALFCMVSSPLTTEEFEQVMGGITQSNEFPPDTRTLWDLRGIDFGNIDRAFEEQVIEIRKQFPERGRARIALIVGDQLGLGMTRMYEILSDDMPQETRTFTDYSEGERWMLEQSRQGEES